MSIKPYDFHTHSVFCDGKNTPEEMVLAAIDKGLSAIGFSGHSYNPFDLGGGMPKEMEDVYFAECRRLQEEYKDKIDILCGIERDIYADRDYLELDYIIGSVHYIRTEDGMYLAVDLDKETQVNGVNKYFGGDYLSYCEAYFDTVSKLCEVNKTDIVGHFDLVKLYNGDGALFDESHPRYIAAAKRAIKKLMENDVLFEINTGGVYRGRRSDPYPSEFILKEIASSGGRIILNGDSHCTDALAFNFTKSVELAKECGFKSIYTLTKDGKKELEI